MENREEEHAVEADILPQLKQWGSFVPPAV